MRWRTLALGVMLGALASGQGETPGWTVLGRGQVVTMRPFGVKQGPAIRTPVPAKRSRGTAQWLPPHEYTASEPIAQIAAGDFNEDGLGDVAALGAHGVQVWLGSREGGGMRVGRQVDAAGAAAVAVAVADVNGDGHTDVLYADAAGELVFLRGDGAGGLAEAARSEAQALTTAILVSDWNSDGIPDVALLGAAREAALLEGDGHGRFQRRAGVRLPGPASAAAAADLDRDGAMDLLVATAGVPELWWFPGLRKPGERVALDAPAAAVGIFEDETAAHITVRADGAGTVTHLLRNDGRGRFDQARPAPGVTLDSPAEVTVDVNGDEAADRVFVSAAANLGVGPRLAGSFTLTKSHTGVWTAGMMGAEFTVQVTGTGTPRITDTLPAGMTLVSMRGQGWECFLGQPTCVWGGAPPVGGVFPPLTVVVNVDANAPGVMTNTVTEESGAQATDTVILGQGGGGPAGADLTVAKTHTGSLTRGGAVTYTVTVQNTGGSATSGPVALTEVPDAALTLTAMSGPGWLCDVPQRRCTTTASVAAGGSFPAVTVNATVAANAPASVSNRAEVSGGGETNTSNNFSVDTDVVPGPNLTVTKTHTGNFFQGQTNATFQIAVRNAGAGPTDGPLGSAVQVNDVPPVGLTLTGLAGSGWACVVADRLCSRTDVLAAGAAYPVITATFTVSPTAAASLSNFVTVFGGGDNTADNNTAEDRVTVDPTFADLTITKSHTGTFYRLQEDAVFTIQVSNIGIVPSAGTVTVTELPPAGMTGALSGPDWACSGLSCNYFGAIPAGGAAPPLTFRASLNGTMPASATNSATVAGGGDTTPDNNSASDPFTVTSADLAISKTHTGSFTAGQVGATYTILVRNLSPTAPATYPAHVTESVPVGLTLTGMSGANWTCATTSCIYNSLLGPNGVTEPLTVTVNIAADAPAVVTNTARLTTLGEFNTDNDTATDPATLGTDLTVTKTHTGNFYRGQAIGANYMIQVTALAGRSTGRITVTDTPPAGLTILSMQGMGWTCLVASRTCETDAVLAPGTPAPPIVVSVSVASDAAAQVTNVATISGGGDLNGNNNTAADPTVIVPLDYNLTISKTHTGTPAPGGNVTYTLTVTNAGTTAAPGTSPSLTVLETPPAGLTITGMTAQNGTCTLGTLTCTTSASLAPGSSLTYTVTGTIAANAASPFTNTASVQASGDVNTSNNTATDSIVFAGAADLTFVSRDLIRLRSLVQQADEVLASATITNVGIGATSGPIQVQIATSAGTQVTEVILGVPSSGGVTCTAPVVTQCSTGQSLPAAVGGVAQGSLNLQLRFSWGALPRQTIRATFTLSGGGDSTPQNNVYVLEVDLVAPDLAINKTHTGSFRQGQTGVTYQISVRNLTNEESLGGFEVEEVPPPGLIVRSMSGAGWACNQPGRPGLRCRWGTSGNGAALGALASTTPLTVVADVAADAPASLANTARIWPTQAFYFDTNPANNTTVDVAQVAQTALNVAVSQGAIALNRATGRFEQLLTVTNLGANQTAVAAVLDNLTNATLVGASGLTSTTLPAGSPYLELGPINTNQTVRVTLQFNRTVAAPITYSLRLLGPGGR